MKMNKTRTLTMIGALVVLLALLVGTTYALFTDKATITNHLNSGDMQLTLIRTDYTHMMLDQDGFVADVTPDGHDDPKDFSAPVGENMFNLDEAQRFVPGSSVSADMVLSNADVNSDTAFNYWFTIVVKGVEDEELPAFVDALLLDVAIEGHPEFSVSGIRLGDEAYVNAETGEITFGTATAPIGVLKIGGEQKFTVTVSVDVNAGNEISNQEILIDLIVNAVQQVTRPNP